MAVLVQAGTSYNAEIVNDCNVLNGGDLQIINYSRLGPGGTSGAPTVIITNGGALHIESDDVSDTSSFAVDDGVLTIDGVSVNVGPGNTDSPNGSVAAIASWLVSGLMVTFSDHSIVDGSAGPITTWAWDFGDSNTSSSPSPIHTYGAPGTYLVQLTVTTSGAATSTWNRYITVT